MTMTVELWRAWSAVTHILEIAQQVGYGLPLTVGQHRIVQAILGATCDVVRKRSWLGRVGGNAPPQQELNSLEQ